MLTIQIPGREELVLNHLILDYNGTIAEDGQVIQGVAERLEELCRDLQIYVITADTHGTAARRCAGLPLTVKTFPTTQVGAIKADEARKLTGGVVCIGNGFNDIGMCDAADLSICVIGREGCCGALLGHCDVVVTSILDALDLLLKTDRLRATLRT
ncbi:MAG: ATPase P [Oscillospiraceae bacterium]|nr:ATPase P [Oscillospiraceae bacterium]MBQ9148518.1 ATPase P [Oscillospiraceae bacterium]